MSARKMSDLEITKLCAEAMGWRPIRSRPDFDTVMAIPVEQFPGAAHYQYAPLKDKRETMMLVEKYHISCIYDGSEWGCDVFGIYFSKSSNLNRAICECVANMQEVKHAVY